MGAMNPNYAAPLAPPAPPMPQTQEPMPGDESAMAAGLAAGPGAGGPAHAAMTRPAHNLHGRAKKQASEPAYGPATGA